MSQKSTRRTVISFVAMAFVAGLIWGYYNIYPLPSDGVVDGYIYREKGSARINFIDYYRIYINIGSQRQPVYLDDNYYRFHSIDAQSGKVLNFVDMGASVFIGRSPKAIWFKVKNAIRQLNPYDGSECGFEAVATKEIQNIDYSLKKDEVELTMRDGRISTIVISAKCQNSRTVSSAAARNSNLQIVGSTPRKSLQRNNFKSTEDFLSAVTLTENYYFNRNYISTNDSWYHIERKITGPVTWADQITLIGHLVALNKGQELLSAINLEAKTIWTVEAKLKGSFVFADDSGLTVVPNSSHLFLHQKAVHISREGKVVWRYSY